MKPPCLLKTILAGATFFLLQNANGQAAMETLYSDGFSNPEPISQGNFTAGSSSLQTYYNSSGNTTQSASGGPGGADDAYLQFSRYGDGVYLGLAAPSSATTWTVSFDYNSPGAYSQFRLTVFGLTNGQYVTGSSDSNSSEGTQLFASPQYPQPSNGWVSSGSLSFTVPAGYDDIAFEWNSNFMPGTAGIDNVLVTELVPEPSTWLAILLGTVLILSQGSLRRKLFSRACVG